MKIAYFPNQVALNGAEPLAAMLTAMAAAGIQTQENSLDADAAIIWSVLWAGRLAANQSVYRHYRSQGKPVIVVDVGALQRGMTWKVAVNNINAQGYYGHRDNLDWDRPAKLNLKLSTPTRTQPHVVIAAQHVKSEQLAGIDFDEWIRVQIHQLKICTDRPIHVRPHPRCKLDTAHLTGVVVETPTKVHGTYDSFDLDFDCHAIINYNSGPGIQAGIAGVRPIVDLTSLAYPIGIGFADLEQPYTIDRHLWLTQISHTEYTVPELQQGLWLKRLETALM